MTKRVAIVGFGFAGGVAAIAAHDAGARVTLLEKCAAPGGISVCSAGGLRIADDAGDALADLEATNAGTSSTPELAALARGMTTLADFARELCEPVGGKIGVKPSPANYPLPGYKTFGFAYVDALADFDAAAVYPHVRGAAEGARLFEAVRRNVVMRGIAVRTGARVERLTARDGRIDGLRGG